MKMKFLLFIPAYLILAQNIFAQSDGDNIFNMDMIHTLKINSTTEPNLYELLQAEESLTNRPYHLVSIEFDGENLDSVGVRVKGELSAANLPEQLPMKIDFNEYRSQQTFDGLKKLNLTNSYTDNYRQKDRVAYELFRRIGVAAPRTAYVEVYINDVFINVYLLVEQIDKTFISNYFADEGSLWKTSSGLKYGFDYFQNVDIFGSSATQRLDYVNLRKFFKYLLVNSIIEAGDSFPYNNYYVYYSEKEDRFHFLPWDYNLSMDLETAWRVDDLEPIADWEYIWSNPEMKTLYLEVACELKDYLLEENYLDALITENEDIILSNSQGATTAVDADTLTTYLMNRRTWLYEMLAEEVPNCESFSYPYEIGDLVINEFVAKSDSVGGVQEPDGGTPDWIELYNNSNEDIILNHHFYLSDDIDFPKKWNFQTPVTIPAQGYQIVWADRDVHQQGAHSNFKIKKSGGDLMLVYKDMTILDQVSYEEQELNKGYARVPNGTGEFVIQDHTFNGDNDPGITATYEVDYRKVTLFPNPTSDRIYFPTDIDINHISIYNTTGQLLYGISPTINYIDLSDMPRGIYYVKIQVENAREVVTQKITKM